MRKAIIAAIVATALFAVGAFAATFELTAENVASDAAPVNSCAAEAVVNFTTSQSYDEGLADFQVTSATVTFLGTNGLETELCDTAKADLALDVDDVDWKDYQDVDVSGSQASFDLRTNPVGAQELVNVSVLVDGVEIETSAA